MAKVKCKGTVLQQDIAATLTAVAQVISIETTGMAAEDYDSTTLDTSGAGKEKEATGYAEGGQTNFELFYDPALAGHQAITDLVTTPANNAWKIIFADTGASEQTFTSSGVEVGQTVDMNDGLKMSVSLNHDGLPVFTT